MAMFEDLSFTPPVAERVRRDAEIFCGLLDSEITIKFFHTHNPEAGTESEAHLATFANLTNLGGQSQSATVLETPTMCC